MDFCNTLAEILKEAKKAQMLDRLACGPLYSQNYYLSIEEKNRTYYEVYSLPVSEHPPEGYQAISLVCVRQDGRYESPATVSNMCQTAKKRLDGMELSLIHIFFSSSDTPPHFLIGCAESTATLSGTRLRGLCTQAPPQHDVALLFYHSHTVLCCVV